MTFVPCRCGRPAVRWNPDECGVCIRARDLDLWWAVLVHKATWTYEKAARLLNSRSPAEPVEAR